MSRLPVAANKRKKKKKEKRGALDTYLDFGALLHKKLEDSLIKDPVKISDAYVIEELAVPKRLPSIRTDVYESVGGYVDEVTVSHSALDFWTNTTKKDEWRLGPFKRGDRVELTSRRHGDSDNNPYYKGEDACVGTVLGESSESCGWTKVKWDNGCSNNYEPEDLSFYSIAQCKSIW